jgi:ribonuclease HI
MLNSIESFIVKIIFEFVMTALHRLYTDGSYLPYAQTSGIGGYLLDEHNQTIFEFSELIPNNQVFSDPAKFEILALMKGLQLCLQHNITSVQCFSDEQTLCRILSIKNEEQLSTYIERNPLLQSITCLIPEFDALSFEYIPRNENKKADKLSRQKIYEKMEQQPDIAQIEVAQPLMIPGLVFSEKMTKEQRENFNSYKKNYTDFYVFSILSTPLPGFKEHPDMAHESLNLEVWQVQKNKQDIHSVKIHSQSTNASTFRQDLVNLVADTLQKCDLPKIGIMLHGKHHMAVEYILKGRKPVTHRLKKSLENLMITLQNFDEVVFYNDTKIIEHLFPSLSNTSDIQINTEMNKQIDTIDKKHSFKA